MDQPYYIITVSAFLPIEAVLSGGPYYDSWLDFSRPNVRGARIRLDSHIWLEVLSNASSERTSVDVVFASTPDLNVQNPCQNFIRNHSDGTMQQHRDCYQK